MKTRCDRRRFGACGTFQHGAGPGVVLPDAAEWRHLRAPEDFAARDGCAVHDAAATFRRDANTGLGSATEGGSSGHYFSAHSFGHTGFTGTSIWIDPDRQLFVVLLTNRVHPTRENTKIQQVRPALHDAVMQALGFATAAAAAPAK